MIGALEYDVISIIIIVAGKCYVSIIFKSFNHITMPNAAMLT